MKMKIECRLGVIFAEMKLKDKTFTQKKFAEEIKMSYPALNALVNGKSLPGLEGAYRISHKLGKPVEEIWVVVD
jgi:DNA-binding XRE family transcriptional regulator